jgi:5'-3' exoribonuclease 2
MSAREAAEKDEMTAEFDKMLRDKRMAAFRPGDKIEGEEATDEGDDVPKKTWDSNAITPGTPFMHLLAESLKYWTQYMLNTDPSWANMKVIISDASVPGEGEHKIMNFVRSQRRSPDHNPNTRHVIYGLDADLIMLGLVTHEPHFRVLREDVFANGKDSNACRKCGQNGHYADQCTGQVKPKEDEHKNAEPEDKPFIWLHISVLREYLEEEMQVRGTQIPFDLERALDDWVFMCFFVGNDFLPHLPSLEIREDGIDTLIKIYRNSFKDMGGYVTKDGQVIMERAKVILKGLAGEEDDIFRRRKQVDDRREESIRRRAEQAERNSQRMGYRGGPPAKRVKETTETYANVPFFDPSKLQSNEARRITHDMAVNKHAGFDKDAHNKANMSAAAVLKAQLKEQAKGHKRAVPDDEDSNETPAADESPAALGKRKVDALETESSDSGTPGRATPVLQNSPKVEPAEGAPDTVKLWETGYAERYYEQKFHVAPDDYEFRHKVANAYMEGLCWVLLYYLQGCPSWTWYYPYHYAPFAADFVDIDKLTVTFEKGKPFLPYEQLMAVLPAASNHAIPKAYRSLMSDSDSPILDFYPEDFVLDLNGKKFAWQGVALLPFIDMDKLKDAMRTKDHLLTDDERARNIIGEEMLIFSTQHPLYDNVTSAFYSKKAETSTLALDATLSHGLIGKVDKAEGYIPHSALTFPLESDEMPDVENNQSIR